MSWLWAALTPHPPVIIPEVGRGRENEALATVDGIERLSERVSKSRPDHLLVLSPHQPYARGALCLNEAPRLEGSFTQFGASVSIEMNSSPKLRLLAESLITNGLAVSGVNSPDITGDHGALVPLYFIRKDLRKHGLELPDVVIASPIGLGPEKSLSLGKALASFDDQSSWALLASGDLSHRLTHHAPAGYSREGKKFDESVVAALTSTDPQELLALSPQKRDEVGECGLCSVLVMLGLCRALSATIEVISYEGPFGVGYCNAISVLK